MTEPVRRSGRERTQTKIFVSGSYLYFSYAYDDALIGWSSPTKQTQARQRDIERR